MRNLKRCALTKKEICNLTRIYGPPGNWQGVATQKVKIERGKALNAQRREKKALERGRS